MSEATTAVIPKEIVDLANYPSVVGYSMIAVDDSANPDVTKIIESYMTSDGRWFYREHFYGFYPFNAWMEGMPADLPVYPPRGNENA